MKIGYIYLFGEEWGKWKKHNKPLPVIIDELKDLGCDKIYMDVFIEDATLKEIERIDIKELLERISGSSGKYEFQLYIRGRMDKKMDYKDFPEHINNEFKRIKNRNHRKI